MVNGEWDLIGQWAVRQPEKPALVEGRTTVTYAALQQFVTALAGRLHASGLRPGQRLAVALPNGIPFVVAYLAALHAGVTMIPLNPELPEETLTALLERSRPELLIREPDAIHLEATAGAEVQFHGDGAALAAIFFTSGTTGQPKGVCHDVETMITNVRDFNSMVGLDERCRMLHVLPMFYVAGFLNTVLSPLAAGGTVIIAPRFSPQSALGFWKPAMEVGVNAAWLTPTMLAMLTKLYRSSAVGEWARSSLTHLFVGTAPLPRAVGDEFARCFGVVPLESYGMTEVLLTAANLPGAGYRRASAGKLLPNVLMRPRNTADTGDPELWIKTPYLMRGYWMSPTEPPRLELTEGYFPTGDCGKVDHEGYLFITGRRKDLIIRGGTNVSPRAVEELLLQHPAVADVAVTGLPHPILGEEVAAWISLEAGWEEDGARDDIIRFARTRLTADAAPSRLFVVSTIPRNSAGKVLKHMLMEPA